MLAAGRGESPLSQARTLQEDDNVVEFALVSVWGLYAATCALKAAAEPAVAGLPSVELEAKPAACPPPASAS